MCEPLHSPQICQKESFVKKKYSYFTNPGLFQCIIHTAFEQSSSQEFRDGFRSAYFIFRIQWERALTLHSCSHFYKLKIDAGPKLAAFCTLPGKPPRTSHNRTILLSLAMQAVSPEACEETAGLSCAFPLQPGNNHRILFCMFRSWWLQM